MMKCKNQINEQLIFNVECWMNDIRHHITNYIIFLESIIVAIKWTI